MIDKVQENRVRRAAERRRLHLRKSARRDPRAPDFERYKLVDMDSGEVILGHSDIFEFRATLDEVEAFLGYQKPAEAPDAPAATPASLEGMMTAWFAEKPERMRDVFGFAYEQDPQTPEDAAREVINGKDRHFAIVPPAEHILEAIEDEVSVEPSEVGRSIVSLLRTVAGKA